MNNTREEELIYQYILRQYAKLLGVLAPLAEAGVLKSVLMKRLSEEMQILKKSVTARLEIGITRAWNDANKATFKLMDKKFSKVELPESVRKVIYDPNKGALEKFINREKGGMNLSDRVWEQTKEARKIIKKGLVEGIENGTPAREISKNIKEALLAPEIPTPPKGVYKSPIKNAMRVVRTEVNASYRTADQANWNKNPIVLGYKIQVSNTRSKNVKARCELCRTMEGIYPNTFQWSSWHPNCYSEDSEVMTNNGWKLFKDLKFTDLIYSLNPGNNQPEYVKYIVHMQRKYKGDMVRFSNRALDILVTPEHKIKFIDSNGLWKEQKAITFGDNNINNLVFKKGIISECRGKTATVFNKDIEHYDGLVYDIQLERNHIMYIRRNGKCFWGSNCLCIKTPIVMTREYLDKYNRLIAQGENTAENIKKLQVEAGLITKLPNQLTSYVEGGGGKKTWWYSTNKKMFNEKKD